MVSDTMWMSWVSYNESSCQLPSSSSQEATAAKRYSRADRIINSTASAHSEISRQLHLEPHRVKCMAGHRSQTPKKCVNMPHHCVLHAVQMTNTNPSEMYQKGRSIKGAATGKGMRAEGTAEEARPALRVLITHTHGTLKRSEV